MTPWTEAHQASLSFTISQSLHKIMPIESVMSSNHLILCFPLPFLPSIFTSIRVFSNEWPLRIRRSRYWSFSYNIGPPNKTQGLFPLGWLIWSPCSPRESQESSPTPQFESTNSSWRSTFVMVQFSYPYITTGKTIALAIQTFLGKWCLWFLLCCLGLHYFPSKGQASFNFMAVVTIHSDFEA